MDGVDALDFKPGDPVRAANLQALRDAILRPGAAIRGSAGLNVRRGSDGSTQVALITGAGTLFVGKASGAITARSGATLGTGTVAVWVLDSTTDSDYVDSGDSVDVQNISSTTGGIPDTTWVVCGYQEDGTAVVITADCGN